MTQEQREALVTYLESVQATVEALVEAHGDNSWRYDNEVRAMTENLDTLTRTLDVE